MGGTFPPKFSGFFLGLHISSHTAVPLSPTWRTLSPSCPPANCSTTTAATVFPWLLQLIYGSASTRDAWLPADTPARGKGEGEWLGPLCQAFYCNQVIYDLWISCWCSVWNCPGLLQLIHGNSQPADNLFTAGWHRCSRPSQATWIMWWGGWVLILFAEIMTIKPETKVGTILYQN